MLGGKKLRFFHQRLAVSGKQYKTKTQLSLLGNGTPIGSRMWQERRGLYCSRRIQGEQGIQGVLWSTAEWRLCIRDWSKGDSADYLDLNNLWRSFQLLKNPCPNVLKKAYEESVTCQLNNNNKKIKRIRIAPNAKCRRVLVFALWLISIAAFLPDLTSCSLHSTQNVLFTSH